MKYPINTVLLFTGSLLLIFGIFVFINRAKYSIKANRVLGLLMISMALIPFSIGMAGLNVNPIFYLHGPLIVFIAAPLSYFYYKTYLSNQYRYSTIDILHFVPLIIEVFLWYHFVLNPGEIIDKSSYLLGINNATDFYRLQRKIAGFTLSTIYFIIFIKMVRSYHLKAKEEYSYTNNDVLKWFYLLMCAIYIIPFFPGSCPYLAYIEAAYIYLV